MKLTILAKCRRTNRILWDGNKKHNGTRFPLSVARYWAKHYPGLLMSLRRYWNRGEVCGLRFDSEFGFPEIYLFGAGKPVLVEVIDPYQE